MLKYQILMDSKTTNLSKMVTEAISNGWTLYGDPFSRPAGICQAMTKKAVKGGPIPAEKVADFS